MDMPELDFGIGENDKEITSFSGEYHFLSNFYVKYPYLLIFNNIKFVSLEHAYQYTKCADDRGRNLIIGCKYPGQAKIKSREVNIIPDWDIKRVGVMEKLITIKFSDTHLRNKLLATGNKKLIEENDWGDKFWGKCGGVGENKLGEMLMDERYNIRISKLVK